MSEIVIVRLKRNGWPEDQAPEMIDEALLDYSEGGFEDDNEITKWREWRLESKIVKRSAHVHLKRNIVAEAMAAEF